MDLHYKGTLTKEELADIITVINSPTKGYAKLGPKVNRLPLIFLLVLALLMGTLLILDGIARSDVLPLALAIGPALVVFFVLVRLTGKGQSSPEAQAEAIWKDEANRARVLEGTVTDEGIMLRVPIGESLVKWKGFVGYGEFRDLLVLAEHNGSFFSVPKRFFKAEKDWDEFRTTVAGKLNVSHRVGGAGSRQPSA